MSFQATSKRLKGHTFQLNKYPYLFVTNGWNTSTLNYAIRICLCGCLCVNFVVKYFNPLINNDRSCSWPMLNIKIVIFLHTATVIMDVFCPLIYLFKIFWPHINEWLNKNIVWSIYLKISFASCVSVIAISATEKMKR